MKKGIYTIYDKKSATYLPPFTENTDGTAIRQIQDMVAGGQALFARHPEDFTLVNLGHFDDEKGEVTPGNLKIVIEVNELTSGE